MIFYFILSYFIKINESNIDDVKNQSYKRPAFVLIFSPHCHYCKIINPLWEELMKKYESDPDVLIGECNVVEHSKECKRLFSYPGYPTFIVISNNESKSISPERTIEAFINETEKLKSLNLTIPCPIFPQDFTNNYPAFILKGNDSNHQKCQTIEQIIKIHPPSKSHLYIDPTSSENESFVVQKSTGEIIQYEGPNEIQYFTDFLNEFIFEPFGNWNYSDASFGNKRIGLLIHHSDSDFPSFLKIVSPYLKDFSFCKIYASQFEAIFPNLTFKKKQLPAFAISNLKKTKFLILINVLRNPRFSTLLRKAADGLIDEKAIYNFSPLFPIPEGNEVNETENFELKNKILNGTKMPKKLATFNFKIALCIALFVSSFAVCAIIRFINNSGNKIE